MIPSPPQQLQQSNLIAFSPRVLVVEDDRAIRKLFSDLLRAQGIALDAVEDGEQGLALFGRNTYDLVIIDKQLPGMNGVALLQQVKALRPEIDVIVMTAYADMQSVLTAVEIGVYDYLVKPFVSLEDVRRRIGRALEKRRMMLENAALVAYLKEANVRIEEMNRSLEALVQERTQQLSEANARLEQLTLTDDVTGLYNQRFLHHRLPEEFERARRYGTGLCVLMLDLDRFKSVNDSHDHLFGSRVLKRIGALLITSLRRTDMVVRFGGDEFVVVLPHTALTDAMSIAERIRSDVESASVGDGDAPWHVTVSIGVASLKESQVESPRALLEAADRALYLAKSRGRNRSAVSHGKHAVMVVA